MAIQKTLLLVFHSMTGGTEQMTYALAQGVAAESGIRVRMQHALQTMPEDVLAADGYVFATPENLGAISGLMKDFFDRCYYPALEKINGRPYASLICAGSDGQNAARQIERIATGWRLRSIAEPLIVCTHAQSTAEILGKKSIATKDLARCTELGSLMAEGLALGIF
jgi:NAD(P)H-dependent FMN reductase